MKRLVILLSVIAVVASNSRSIQAEKPPTAILTRAHAHNDYYQQRPLLDALQHGFCSVEADVFLVDGELFVGHHFWELRPGRTLQALYLEPLLQRVRRHEGWVFNGQTFTLLVDIKSKGTETYRVLSKVLQDYGEMLSSVKDGRLRPRAVQIVLSGDRPREQIKATVERYVFVDGRLDDLNRDPPTHLVPLVSASWSELFTWRGRGTMPVEERAKLLKIVEQVHAQKRELRFWATPDRPAVWTELADAGADWIGTDDLAALQRFWRERPAAMKHPLQAAP